MSDVFRVEDVQGQSNVPVLPALPGARLDMRVRVGRLTDYEFVDALQKEHKTSVGFLYEGVIKGHLAKGNLLIAESSQGRRIGYVMGVDRYMKRDEVGVIYQMCVVPEYRRSLVAANLLKAQFERSAYGCRLYGCWCAQDLEHANTFWESMGFVALAFRTGSAKTKFIDLDGTPKTGGRLHIFWQKRIREGDHGLGNPDTNCSGGGTGYWFPSLTGNGAIAEDRIVLPIPPGTHWSDTKPVVLPEGPSSEEDAQAIKLLESKVQDLEREKKKTIKQRKNKAAQQALPAQSAAMGGLRFGPPPPEQSPTEQSAAQQAQQEVAQELKQAKKQVKQAKKKFDPAQVAFARELKDRWLEEVLAQPGLIGSSEAKYEVCRRIDPGTQDPGTQDGASHLNINASQRIEIVADVEAKRLDAA